MKYKITEENQLHRFMNSLFFVILSLIGFQGLAEQKTTETTIKARSKKTDQGERTDYVDVFRGGKLIKSIKCKSDQDALKPCYPVKLFMGRFVIVDCYTHDSVAQSCELTRFNSHAELDLGFKTPFSSETGGDLDDPPHTDILSITSVQEGHGSPEQIEVTGDFQLKALDGLTDFERHQCEDEDCVGFLGASTKATLNFDSHGRIISKKILKNATSLYPKEKIISKLTAEISRIEGVIKTGPGEEWKSTKAKLAVYRARIKELQTSLGSK